ncbi:MAG: hypothetical protein QW128_00300 [Thermoprotei archaeon]
MYWALKLFYDGIAFHGSQIQPNLRTVQGELTKTLNELKYVKGPVKFCCRTDAGVSALSQIVTADFTRRPIIGEINSKLPRDMLVWASSELTTEFSIKKLIEWKLYRYYLPALESVNIDKMIEASELIKGRKELGGLSKSGRGGLIDEIRIEQKDKILVIDFKGKYFSWNLIRRSVTALYMIGVGELTINQFINILNNHKLGVHPAPSWNLILLDVGCKLNFIVDQRALYRLKSFATNLSLMMKARSMMMNDIVQFLKS